MNMTNTRFHTIVHIVDEAIGRYIDLTDDFETGYGLEISEAWAQLKDFATTNWPRF